MKNIKRLVSQLTISLFAVLLLAIAGGVGALVLRNSRARNLPPDLPPVQTTADATVSAPVAVESPAPAEPVVESDEFLSAHAVKKAPTTRQPRRRSVADENVIDVTPAREAPAAPPPAVASPQFEKPKSSESAAKTPPALSPQLITPAKSAPVKGKVIQWP